MTSYWMSVLLLGFLTKILRNMRWYKIFCLRTAQWLWIPFSVAMLHWNQWTLLRFCCPSSSEDLWIRKHQPAISNHMLSFKCSNMDPAIFSDTNEYPLGSCMILLKHQPDQQVPKDFAWCASTIQHGIPETPCVHRQITRVGAPAWRTHRRSPTVRHSLSATATTTSIYPSPSCISSGLASSH
jgi:hypothetical protein